MAARKQGLRLRKTAIKAPTHKIPWTISEFKKRELEVGYQAAAAEYIRAFDKVNGLKSLVEGDDEY